MGHLRNRPRPPADGLVFGFPEEVAVLALPPLTDSVVFDIFDALLPWGLRRSRYWVGAPISG